MEDDISKSLLNFLDISNTLKCKEIVLELLRPSLSYKSTTNADCQISKQLINIKIYKDQQTGKQPFLIARY